MSVVSNTLREKKKNKATAAAKTCNHSEMVSLVEEAAGGNFSAFGDLYNIYLDRIYRYVYYQVKDKMTAEDITEDVFIKAWRAIGACKGRGETFSSWLYRIAHNHLVSTLRRMKKCTSLEDRNIVEVVDPKQEIEAKAEYQELFEQITCLPHNQKQIIILKFVEGFENREIGRIISKNEGAIRISQMRALATLRQRLGSDGGGNEN
jgi:RNA polymerase sigma-70 factor (ECF subfamily)